MFFLSPGFEISGVADGLIAGNAGSHRYCVCSSCGSWLASDEAISITEEIQA